MWAEGPKAVKAQRSPGGELRTRQGAVPDDAGAQQGRGLGVREGVGDLVGERLRHDRVLREASVPGDSDPGPGRKAPRPFPASLHGSDPLVAGDDRETPGGEVSLDHVEVGSTDPADAHADQDLPGARRGVGNIPQGERGRLDRAGPVEDRRFHGKVSRVGSRISNPPSSIAFRIGPTLSVATRKRFPRSPSSTWRVVSTLVMFTWKEPMIAASCASVPGRSGTTTSRRGGTSPPPRAPVE